MVFILMKCTNCNDIYMCPFPFLNRFTFFVIYLFFYRKEGFFSFFLRLFKFQSEFILFVRDGKKSPPLVLLFFFVAFSCLVLFCSFWFLLSSFFNFSLSFFGCTQKPCEYWPLIGCLLLSRRMKIEIHTWITKQKIKINKCSPNQQRDLPIFATFFAVFRN